MGMIIRALILVLVLLMVILTMAIAKAASPMTPEEQAKEDEDQRRWLEDWKKG